MKTTKKRTRRRFTGEFKAKVAVEALKAQETVNQIRFCDREVSLANHGRAAMTFKENVDASTGKRQITVVSSTR